MQQVLREEEEGERRWGEREGRGERRRGIEGEGEKRWGGGEGGKGREEEGEKER